MIGEKKQSHGKQGVEVESIGSHVRTFMQCVCQVRCE